MVGVWSLRIPEILDSQPTAVRDPESFLLIFRISHIVTDARPPEQSQEGRATSSGEFSGFPAYSRLLTMSSPTWGAAPLCLQRGYSYLRHVVTPQLTPLCVGPIEWPDHFCLAPRVATRVGLYLHRE
jgi:hypothetical protein